MAIESVITKDLGIINFLDCCGGPDLNPPVIIDANAIIKPKILYVNGYDNGSFQAFRDVRFSLDVGPQSPLLDDWTYVETGGRNGKGYLLTDDSNLLSHKAYIRIPVAAIDIAQAGDVSISDAETNVRLGGMHVAFNLFGQTIVNPLTVLATFADSIPQLHTKIEILPDLTIRAATAPSTIHQVSTIKVPANGWFVLEKQWCISRRGNATSGFILCKLFTPDNIATGGAYVISAIGVKTQAGTIADTFAYYAFGSQCDPTLEGLKIGIDDVVIYGAYGDRKRFINDTRVGSAWPTSDASIQSNVAYSWSVSVDATPDGIADPPTILSGSNNFGLSDRWKNASRIDLSNQPPTTPGFHSTTPGEWIVDFHGFGELSIFSTPPFWTEGPIPYLGDTLQRNYFADTAIDFYTLGVNDSNIIQIEGVQPFVAQGRRSVTGTITPGDAIVALGGPHDIDVTSGRPNTISQSLIRSNGVIGFGRYNYSDTESLYAVQVFDGSNNFIFNSSLWSHGGTLPYTINPYSFIDTDPDGGIPWLMRDADKLRALQVGIGGSFTIIDQTNILHPGRYLRQIYFDIAQLGLQYAYHTQEFLEDELPPFPPRAGFGIDILTDIPTRRLRVFPASIDWDGSIVSAILNWGDGSLTEDLLGDDSDSGGLILEHFYATTGTKHVTLTATDNDGLVTVYTYDFVLPNNDPVANFSVADAGGNLADLTDTSTDDGGTIVAWLWKVDGVTIATTQNVVGHDFGAPGTYTISLTVTDNDGATNEAHTDVTIPLGGAGGCGLSAAALADTAWVQGDDYNGGNPPLPAYVNTAAFDSWYEGSNFRETYDTAFASAGVDHRISSSVQFNGRNTLEMDFGAGHNGAGWYGGLTDDGDPTETNAPFFGGYRTLWSRMILAADAGVMSDAGATGFGQGLTIYEMDLQLAFGSAIIMNRANNLYLDVNEGAGHGGNQAPILIAADGFAGSGTFKELITLLERENEGDGTFRIRVWYGDACSLNGVSPLINQLFSPTTLAATNGVVSPVVYFNPTFTPSGAIKHLWVSLHERVPRLNTENGIDNPYGVALT